MMSEVERRICHVCASLPREYFCGICDGGRDYNALAAQRDEALAREAELERQVCWQREKKSDALTLCGEACARHDAIKRHLAKAESLLVRWGEMFAGGIATSQLEDLRNDNAAFLASPGCADGEKS